MGGREAGGVPRFASAGDESFVEQLLRVKSEEDHLGRPRRAGKDGGGALDWCVYQREWVDVRDVTHRRVGLGPAAVRRAINRYRTRLDMAA